MKSLPITFLIDHFGISLILLLLLLFLTGYFMRIFWFNRNLKKFVPLFLVASTGLLLIFFMFNEKNNYENWKNVSFLNYIQSLPVEKKKLNELVLLDTESKPGFYYIKATFGEGRIYEGIAKVVLDPKKNEVFYRKVQNQKERELNGYLLMEIHVNHKPLSAIDNIAEHIYHETPYYPGLTENQFSYWKMFVFFFMFLALAFLFATILAYLRYFFEPRESQRNEELISEPPETIEEICLEKSARVIRS